MLLGAEQLITVKIVILHCYIVILSSYILIYLFCSRCQQETSWNGWKIRDVFNQMGPHLLHTGCSESPKLHKYVLLYTSFKTFSNHPIGY